MNDKYVKIIVSEDMTSQNQGNNNQTTVLINPVFVLRAPFVPTALSIAVLILTTGFEQGIQHDIRITVKNPTAEELLYDSGINKILNPINTDNFNFNLDLKNLPFMNEGQYIIEFFINDAYYSEVFFIKANKVLGG